MQRWFCALILAAFALGGCSNNDVPKTNAGAAPMVLRVYQVPPESTKNLEGALRQSFATGDKASIGTISSPNPGQLLVLAPADLQDSIATSLKSLGDSAKPAASAAPEQIRLQFWSIDAVPGAGDDDAALASLSGALGEARKTLGTVHFVLRDNASSVSGINEDVNKSWFGAPNESGSADTKTLAYRVNNQYGRLALYVHYSEQIPVTIHPVSYMSVGMSSNIPVQLGQTLVLSQAPIFNAPLDGKGSPGPATRLYLIRVDRVAAN